MWIATLRACSVLSLLGLVLASYGPARAVTLPIAFTGTEQDFNATIDVSGNLRAEGGGTIRLGEDSDPFLLTAPLDHWLWLSDIPTSVSTNPKSDPLGATANVWPGQLSSLSKLDVDFLNGQTLDFKLNTINLTSDDIFVNAIFNKVDVSGTLSQFAFHQTGASIAWGGVGSGTFSVNGDLNATISDLLLDWVYLQKHAIDDQVFRLPTAFSGTWKIIGPSNNQKLSLDGNWSITLPLSLMTNLTTELNHGTHLGITAISTFDLAASLNVSFNYHLESPLTMAPEPGSIVLLGLGLGVVMIPLVRRRCRK